MSHIKHDNNPHDRPDNRGKPHHHHPYWKRAHRSVGFWIAVFLMLAAMVVYVMSNDLGGWHRGQHRQPISAPAGI